ncbi:putative dynactin arp1 p25 subunit protein [Botryosphaeria dothidea]|uniref:Dynactin arp1 p25 subunit protein n=1 Tax=Botryosphaeria dothidea TaxID=55169 RepID=A0A8H4MXK9_9PEZI|nr:putative dynactin arp1 p25 subunit protein [Botryosphaeria dothidea]
MLAKKCLLVGAILLNAASGLVFDPDWPLGLILKRQDDMSEAEYNCHDNCGQAIIAGRGSDPCNEETFKHDYDACLQCAGSDNVNIWQYYGDSLTKVASSCGYSTTPASGTQAAVSAAITASSAASTAASTPAAATPVTTPASNSTVSGTSSSTSAAASTAAATASSTSSSTAASASATGAASSAAIGWASVMGPLSVLGYFVLGF